jgi:hypothetical protein
MRRPALLLLIGVLFAACGAEPASLIEDETEPGDADYAYVIPLGAGEALDQGQPLEILPGEMTVAVGEVIEIVNDDDRGHLVGPFFVGAGETLRQRFASPGEFIGVCTVHPSGELVLEIVEP